MLNISNNNLKSPSLSCLSGLSKLIVLNISNNEIDTIPNILSNILVNLKVYGMIISRRL